MNSRWQANKIGLINFWYYDEQEFPFVKGRMLLRGSNGSGKSVTMQSVVPLLLDGNMSPERLDPFGSRDRKMSSYLLEENDGREERTMSTTDHASIVAMPQEETAGNKKAGSKAFLRLLKETKPPMLLLIGAILLNVISTLVVLP